MKVIHFHENIHIANQRICHIDGEWFTVAMLPFMRGFSNVRNQVTHHIAMKSIGTRYATR